MKIKLCWDVTLSRLVKGQRMSEAAWFLQVHCQTPREESDMELYIRDVPEDFSHDR